MWNFAQILIARGVARVRPRAMLVVASLLLIATHVSGAVRPLDDALSTNRAHLQTRAPTGGIVVVEIDSASLREAQTWPWPRERFATAIRNLRAAGAHLVAFDVDFSARSTTTDDALLGAAIDAEPGAVVLPAFLQPHSLIENAPLASLSRDAVVASVNVPIDPDGRVRHYFRGYANREHYRASMGAVLAGVAYGETAPFLIDYGIRVSEIDRISFRDAYRGAFDPQRVRGRVVLVGATAVELGDEFATPLHAAMPGVLVHALAYESLVQDRALVQPSGVITLLLALVVLFALWPPRRSLDLTRLFIRQGAVLSLAVLAPMLLYAVAPLSVETGLLIVAQALCAFVSVWRELDRRAREIVSQREAHLAFVALHDPETNLPNRRAMLAQLGETIEGEGAGGSAIAVLAIGIDRFALLRGAIGYGAANQAVQALASQLVACTGAAKAHHISTSVLGVTLRAPSEAAAKHRCAEALSALNSGVEIDGQRVELSVRAGVAAAVVGACSAERLLECATLALDQARLKRTRCVNFGEAEIVDPKVQLALRSDVGRGLACNEFSLLYQPKVSARSGVIVGAEALMRWRHPVHGQVAPDRFIAAAEETGAIDVLTRWAFMQAVSDQAEMAAHGVTPPLSINISGRSLIDESFRAFVVDVARRHKANLCLEITETAIIDDPNTAMASLAAFREAGLAISIDDYGAGLSSLSYLKQIAADELKLDKSLIDDLKTRARDRLIVKSTIDLAHGLGLTVVAEGVEDETDFALLAAMGCDCIQGYFVSPPVSRDEFVALNAAAPARWATAL
ncbi:MAG: EAL domain-containing protein [Hyphomonadaceae bacterium]|nr:EAL domain-containing protein [Hyphomonadaceae bacterium]